MKRDVRGFYLKTQHQRGATGEFKAIIEGNFVKPFQQIRALSKQVQGQEKTPAFWEEKAGVTVLSNNKGGVMPDSVVA